MRGTIFKVVAATALFAGLHSLLATRRAKAAATSLLGERRRNALYRASYNAVSLITTTGMVLYWLNSRVVTYTAFAGHCRCLRVWVRSPPCSVCWGACDRSAFYNSVACLIS